MGAIHPQQAGKLFEERFAAGDLDGVIDLYEDGAVFVTAQGAHEGLDAIGEVVAGYLSTGASIVMNESVAFEAGDLALVHWAWTMTLPDGRVAEGASAEVLRRQSDGSWKFTIDNGGGSALIGHDNET
ncbi:MAG: nuclear transport factor 2 family protein [Acidimicrobiia bacterium]|nr:nuclear transport factor 2 family protein [Acidimicrobiia bacterium]